MPVTLEGWVATLLLVGGLVVTAGSNGIVSVDEVDGGGFLIDLLALVIVFVIIAIPRTRGRVRWRWGK